MNATALRLELSTPLLHMGFEQSKLYPQYQAAARRVHVRARIMNGIRVLPSGNQAAVHRTSALWPYIERKTPNADRDPEYPDAFVVTCADASALADEMHQDKTGQPWPTIETEDRELDIACQFVNFGSTERAP